MNVPAIGGRTSRHLTKLIQFYHPPLRLQYDCSLDPFCLCLCVCFVYTLRMKPPSSKYMSSARASISQKVDAGLTKAKQKKVHLTIAHAGIATFSFMMSSDLTVT